VTTTAIQLALVSPARQLAFTQTITTELAPGQSSSIPFTTTAALPLGIWNVQPTLLNGQSPIINQQSTIRNPRFIVHNPPASVSPENELSLSITAPGDTFYKPNETTFTFHVFNHTDDTRAATVRYGLPHHSSESRDYATYGGFDQLSRVVMIGAHSEVTFTWAVTLFARQDSVWARLEENGARAWFNVRTIAPDVDLQMALIEPPPYAIGRPLSVVFTATNFSELAITPTLSFNVRGDNGIYYVTRYSQDLPLYLPPASSPQGTQVTTTLTFTLAKLTSLYSSQSYDPGRAAFMTAGLKAGPVVLDGAGLPQIYLDDTLFALSAQPVAPWVAGESGSVSVALTNRHPTLGLTGILTATLIDPQRAEIATSTQAISLNGGQATLVDVPLSTPSSLRQGAYQLRVNATDGYSVLTYTLQLPTYQYALLAAFERPAYRAGETASLGVPVRNTGIFQPNLDVQVQAADLEYSDTQTISPLANGQGVITFTLGLPSDLASGAHPISLTYRTPAGETLWTQPRSLYVTAPELQAVVDEPASEAGDPISVTVTNVGGAIANAEYDLTLYDGESAALQTVAGSLDLIGVDQSQVVAIAIPPEARTGQYLLRATVCETGTNQVVDVFIPIDVIGASAELSATAGSLIYAEGDPVTLVVTVTNTGPALTDARLDLGTTSTSRSTSWGTFDFLADGPWTHEYINDVVLDNNRLWVGIYDYDGGAVVLDDGGTPFDTSDDQWQHFTEDDGLTWNEVTGIAIDQSGYKWFGHWHHGVSVLDDGGTPFDKSDDRWTVFHVAEYLFDHVWQITVDTGNRKWLSTDVGLKVLDDKGTPFDPADDVWQTFSTADGLADDRIAGVTIDAAGRKWIAAGYAMSLLDDGGTPFEKSDDNWLTFTPADGLADGWVEGALFDTAGRLWLATSGGISVFDDHGTPFEKSDDVWQTFTEADGLLSNTTREIWIDWQGQKWITSIDGGVSVLDDGGTPFDKSDDVWLVYTTDNGLADANVQSIVGGIGVDAPIWIGTWEGLNVVQETFGGPGGTWQMSPVSLDVAASETITLAVPMDPLTQTGKFRLNAQLTSSAGQELAPAQDTFYIFPASESGGWQTRPRGLAALYLQSSTQPPLVLTLDASPLLARPSQDISLSGSLYNFSVSQLEPTLVITQDGETLYTAGPFTIEPGGEVTFTTATTAPATPGFSRLEAAAVDPSYQVSVQEAIEVANPIIVAEVESPLLVGREPFSLTVLLNNPGPIDAQVDVDGVGAPETISMPAGEMRLVQRDLQIDRDTTYTLTLSGDTAQVLVRNIAFGEAVEAAFDPQSVYPAGHIEIPYTLTNAGQLDVEFVTAVTLSNPTPLRYGDYSQQSTLGSQQFTAFLPVGESADGLLLFDDVPAGDYTLDYETPYQSGVLSFSVGASDQVELLLMPDASAGGLLTTTAVLTNTGVNAVSGTLVLEGDFASSALSVTLESGVTMTQPLTLNLSAAEVGTQPITLTLYHDDGRWLASHTTTVTIGGPDIIIASVPANLMRSSGEVVTLTFGLENRGNQPGDG